MIFNIQETDDLKALKELYAIEENSIAGLNYLKHMAGQAYNLFWLGDTTPMLKAQLLGTEAVKMFMVSAATQNYIKALDPEWVVATIPDGYDVEFHQDGSVTINYEEPVI